MNAIFRTFETIFTIFERTPPDINNVVVFGETGSGKSSIINMLAGREVAKTSSSAVGCTFKSKPHRLDFDGKPITLWDTAGLNEGDAGRVPKAEAIARLYRLLRELSDGVSLLIFVMRAPRIKGSVIQNWKFFHEVICQGEVPIVIVITGLEGEVKEKGDKMDKWWKDNMTWFTEYGIVPAGHACITATRGAKIDRGARCVFDNLYEESCGAVQELIRSKSRAVPWHVPAASWFKVVVERTMEVRSRGCWGTEEVATTTMKTIVPDAVMADLKEQCKMEEGEVQRLAEILSKYA